MTNLIESRASATTNYVGGWFDWNSGMVNILERDKSGKRHLITKPAPWYFYVPDENGIHKTIYGNTASKITCKNQKEYKETIRRFRKKYESTYSPLGRTLMDDYWGRSTPIVNYAFIDIEVDYKSELGFSSPTNPYASINAITVWQSWLKRYVTLAIPPPSFNKKVTKDEWNEAFNEHKCAESEIIICKDEEELLLLFLDLISESDIISGWNSEFFDIPYIVERIKIILGETALKHLCYPGAELPKRVDVQRFGEMEMTYRLSGRNHIDYMRAFKKFTFEGRTSYSLSSIAQDELDEDKLDYDGTLEQLYNNEFIKFCCYNIHDTGLLVKLDEKFNFIALINQMAHENTVLFESIMGTVVYVQTGIANHIHYSLNLIHEDKDIVEYDKVEGAVVLSPHVGLLDWIMAADLNSLYPNTIRSINISPEKIIGQFTGKDEERDWKSINFHYFKDHPDVKRDPTIGYDRMCTLIYEDGSKDTLSALEWRQILQEKKWSISAYGTVFDQSQGPGVIPALLGLWYSDRKKMQAEKNKWDDEVQRLKKITIE